MWARPNGGESCYEKECRSKCLLWEFSVDCLLYRIGLSAPSLATGHWLLTIAGTSFGT